MKTLHWMLAFGAVVAFGAGVFTPAPVEADAELFAEKQCVRCHSIKAIGVEKMVDPRSGKTRRGPDQSGVGLRGYETDFLVDFVQKRVEKESIYEEGEMVDHRGRYRGSEDELRTLISFLQTMKSEEVFEDDGDEDDE